MLKIVQQKFDKAALTYNDFASVQFKCAKILTDIVFNRCDLEKFYPKTILDLGCGTGFCTKLLMDKFKNADFTLNDISYDMLSVAQKSINKNISIINGDMNEIEFDHHDIIVSNLAFQWLENVELTIEKLKKKSKVLAFSTLLDGSFYEWEDLFLENGLKSPIQKYPKTIDGLLCKKEFILYFKNPSSFMKYLKKIGATYSKNSYSIKCLKNILKDNISNCFKITYKVGFCII